jgi:hypothetical protein
MLGLNMEDFSCKLFELFFGQYNADIVLSVVGVHATVLSIMIGFSTAYVLHINSQMNNIENDAYRIAEQVNSIKFSIAWLKLVSPGIVFLENWSSTDDQITMFLSVPINTSEIWEDLFHSDCPPFKIYKEKFDLNNTEINLCLMAVSALRYPFPERMVIKEKGHAGLQPSPILSFADTDSMRKWSDVVRKYYFPIMNYNTWFGVDSFVNKFNWDLGVNTWNKLHGKKEDEENSNVVEKLKRLPVEYLKNVDAIFNIARSVRLKLDRYDYYKRLMPSKNIIIIVLFWAFFAFLSSIILPLVMPITSKFYITWVPCSLYLFLLGYSCINVSRFIAKQRV